MEGRKEKRAELSIDRQIRNIPYIYYRLTPFTMRRFPLFILLAAGISMPADAGQVFGTPSACAPGASGPAALVTTHGFRDRKGNLRIAVYRATEDEFLASGRYVQRIDTPLTQSGPMSVCVPLPGPGSYAIVALHDRNADGKLNVFSDGFGFSNNPKLGHSKPAVDLVAVDVRGVPSYSVTLNYVQGFSPKPWKSPQNP